MATHLPQWMHRTFGREDHLFAIALMNTAFLPDLQHLGVGLMNFSSSLTLVKKTFAGPDSLHR